MRHILLEEECIYSIYKIRVVQPNSIPKKKKKVFDWTQS